MSNANFTVDRHLWLWPLCVVEQRTRCGKIRLIFHLLHNNTMIITISEILFFLLSPSQKKQGDKNANMWPKNKTVWALYAHTMLSTRLPFGEQGNNFQMELKDSNFLIINCRLAYKTRVILIYVVEKIMYFYNISYQHTNKWYRRWHWFIPKFRFWYHDLRV